MPARPIMIAVGGDSGSGKTTLCRGLESVFSDRIAAVSLDDYHSLDRAQRAAVGFTGVDPRATNFAAMEEDLLALREGHAIAAKPRYDHADGRFRGTERVEPKEIVIVNGLFPLYTRALRSLFDVTVWLEPEPELARTWKIRRDSSARGYAEADVAADIDRRKPEVERHIAPQAQHADLVVTFYRGAGWDGDFARLSARIRKGGRLRPLDYAEFASGGTSISQLHRTSESGFPETIIELAGNMDDATADAVADKIWSHVDRSAHRRPQRIGQFSDASATTKTSHALALAQLLIARRVVLIENELLEMVP